MASYRKLPSGKWQAVVKHPSGKRYTKTDPLKRVVVEWAEAKQTAIRRGDFVDPKAGRITLDDWWTKWSETRVVERATASKRESVWRNHIKDDFGSWPIDTIATWDVEKWVAELAKRKSPRSEKEPLGKEAQASAVRLLKQLLRDGVRHKLIRTDPTELIGTPEVPKHIDRFLSIEEQDRLLAAITKPTGVRKGVPRDQPYPAEPDVTNQLFVLLMLEAGLRWEEAAGVHAFRVDLMRKTVRVQEVIERGRRIKPEPKTRAGQRVVPLSDDLVTALSAYTKGRPREGLLFPGADGRPLDYNNWLKRVWWPAVRRAKLAEPLPTPHDCRHSYGSWLAEEGVDPVAIRDLMGHASLRAVERYLHSSERRMQRARNALASRRRAGTDGHGNADAAKD